MRSFQRPFDVAVRLTILILFLAPPAVRAQHAETPPSVEAPSTRPVGTAKNETATGAPDETDAPWTTVVRLNVKTKELDGFGSGTIIHSTADEAIILTAYHVVKNESGKIFVDLFDGTLQRRANQSAITRFSERLPDQAHIIKLDPSRDLALIRVPTTKKLPVSKIVASNWFPEKGSKMVTIGCPNGGDATAFSTTIVGRIDRPVVVVGERFEKYSGIKCSYPPAEGRSGGGLFTSSDHRLAGVMNFRDTEENVGYYASAASVREFIAGTRFAFILDR